MSVWRIGSNYGEEGSVAEVFRQYKIAFAGDENPQERIRTEVLTNNIVAITSGQRIIAVGRVLDKKMLSEIGPGLSERFGDIYALVLEPLFWRNDDEEWLSYDGQGTQFSKSHGRYEDEIIKIFNDRNKEYQENKMKHEIIALLEANKQVVLTGAPGTGKTYLALQIAAKMIGLDKMDDLKDNNERFRFVQFHPAYDYTDFVEGLKPVKASNNTNNSIGFERRDGVFMDFCKKAAKQDGKPCIFVIDEINRADLSRVFGELFFALESDYREKSVDTQYASLREENEEKQFYVPKNVFLIGTMNDIDRSVESIDFALRRRFAWYEVKADEARFDAVISGTALEDTIKEEAKKRYLSLNQAIGDTPELGESYQIGPAYFLKLRKCIATENTDIWTTFWKRHLELLIREYVRGWPKSKKDEQIKKFEAAYKLAPEPPAQS